MRRPAFLAETAVALPIDHSASGRASALRRFSLSFPGSSLGTSAFEALLHCPRVAEYWIAAGFSGSGASGKCVPRPEPGNE